MATATGDETVLRGSWVQIGVDADTTFLVVLRAGGVVKLRAATSAPGDSDEGVRLKLGNTSAAFTLDSGDKLWARAVEQDGGIDCVVDYFAK